MSKHSEFLALPTELQLAVEEFWEPNYDYGDDSDMWEGREYDEEFKRAVQLYDSFQTKRISLDNGASFLDAIEAMPEIEERGIWETVAHYMDDETREKVHAELAPCDKLEFLERYLEIAPSNLIIG